MYKLKVAVQRGSALLGAVGLLVGVGASAIPAFVSADALNPLTERSLTLSSSSPGWSYTDGSGNQTYANPNSGANGQQTGNTFSFNVSSTKSVNAFTFQYCIYAAGACTDPGNDATHGTDTPSTSDLQVVTGTGAGNTPAEISGTTYSAITDTTPGTRGDTCFEADGTTQTTCEYTGSPATSGTDEYPGLPKMDNSEGNFVVLTGPVGSQTYDGGWTMKAVNQEETGATGNKNMITLVKTDAAHANPANGDALTAGEHIEVKFYATSQNYITNPGVGSFFVKINDYQIPVAGGAGSEAPVDQDTDANPITGGTDPTNYIIDGGVTVANVMNESIEIQTKVLETMQFSVGTVDPDTLTGGAGNELDTATGGTQTTHGACDNILPSTTSTGAHNVLFMGDENDEHALSTSDTFGTHSYWRLSSNSSAGASVYYAGATLHDTEGDDINPIGTTPAPPQLGTEQFGLALDNDATANHFYVNADNTQDDTHTITGGANYDTGEDSGTANDGALDPSTNANPSLSDGWDHATGTLAAHNPQLFPLVAQTPYDLGGYQSGAPTAAPNTNSSVFNPDLNNGNPIYVHTGPGALPDYFNNNLRFAFDPTANTVPALLATENNQVVDCVTGKMRYIGNIAAITPAGIYTTKINYIAAPQY